MSSKKILLCALITLSYASIECAPNLSTLWRALLSNKRLAMTVSCGLLASNKLTGNLVKKCTSISAYEMGYMALNCGLNRVVAKAFPRHQIFFNSAFDILTSLFISYKIINLLPFGTNLQKELTHDDDFEIEQQEEEKAQTKLKYRLEYFEKLINEIDDKIKTKQKEGEDYYKTIKEESTEYSENQKITIEKVENTEEAASEIRELVNQIYEMLQNYDALKKQYASSFKKFNKLKNTYEEQFILSGENSKKLGEKKLKSTSDPVLEFILESFNNSNDEVTDICKKINIIESSLDTISEDLDKIEKYFEQYSCEDVDTYVKFFDIKELIKTYFPNQIEEKELKFNKLIKKAENTSKKINTIINELVDEKESLQKIQQEQEELTQELAMRIDAHKRELKRRSNESALDIFGKISTVLGVLYAAQYLSKFLPPSFKKIGNGAFALFNMYLSLKGPSFLMKSAGLFGIAAQGLSMTRWAPDNKVLAVTTLGLHYFINSFIETPKQTNEEKITQDVNNIIPNIYRDCYNNITYTAFVATGAYGLRLLANKFA